MSDRPNLVAAELSTVRGTLASLLENPIGGTRFSGADVRLVQELIERLDVVISIVRDRGDAGDAGDRLPCGGPS